MSSDFFLEEADKWRDEAWEIIRKRRDVKFFLLTKRPQRVLDCLPKDWNDGWENVFFNVTCENQNRVDERIPLLLQLPFKHKGIMCAPFLGPISISKYLSFGGIEQVICGGENYGGSRYCNFEWVKQLHSECVLANVTFCFIETGSNFIKDGRQYKIPQKTRQSVMAFKSAMNFVGKPIKFYLETKEGPVLENNLYRPHYRENCRECSARLICNGCSDCGKCRGEIIAL